MDMDNYYYPAGSTESNDNILNIWNKLTNNSKGSYIQVEVA
jgi:hypothetical protein